MRIGYASTTQTQYYDRAPITRSQVFGTTVGPHGSTTRWTYTVPSNKQAYIQFARSSNNRATAAAPAAVYASQISITPNGGSEAFVCDTDAVDNTLNVFRFEGYANLGLAEPGDVVSGKTIDLSTGGTVSYGLACSIIEFGT